jgi:hypothetical protein
LRMALAGTVGLVQKVGFSGNTRAHCRHCGASAAPSSDEVFVDVPRFIRLLGVDW